jgi:hypothetical protein
MLILKKRAPFGVVVWGLLTTFFLKIPKFVWIGCLSRTMFESGRQAGWVGGWSRFLRGF